ncbi:UNVERIFIED_CONTAM: hypothetical protein FKN15_025793 [Acipenser sinensis]
MLINAAYKPGRVLRELQLVEDPQGNFQEETLKAKKQKSPKLCFKVPCLVPNSHHTVALLRRRLGIGQLEGGPRALQGQVRGFWLGTLYIHLLSGFIKQQDFLFLLLQDSEEDEDQDGPEDDTGSEETSSEQREDQTDTSSVEVLTTRPRRAAALRRNTDTARPTSIERSRRKRTTRSLSYTEDIKYHPAKRSAAKVENREDEDKLVLNSNPLEWSVADVVRFIKSTDCAPLTKIFQEQVLTKTTMYCIVLLARFDTRTQFIIANQGPILQASSIEKNYNLKKRKCHLG